MSNGFELARGLMQIASLKEQKKARKEELEFKKAYEAPFREALTNLYNAQATRMADRELTGLQEEQKRETGLKANRLQLVLDEIEKLDKDSPLRSQAIFGIRDTQDMANELRMMGLRLQEQSLDLRRSQAEVKLSTDRIDKVFGDDPIGAAIRRELKDAGKLSQVVDEAIEGAFDVEVPTKKEGESFLEKIRSLLGKKPAPSEPFRGPPVGMGYPYVPKAKPAVPPRPKPAPVKAPEKKGGATSIQFTTDETAAIYEKARENDVNPLDIAAGVQKLVATFPDLDKDTLLEAHNLLAEGEPVEDVRKFIEERKEK